MTAADIVRHFMFRFASLNGYRHGSGALIGGRNKRWPGRVDKRHDINEPEDRRRQYVTDMRWVKAAVSAPAATPKEGE